MTSEPTIGGVIGERHEVLGPPRGNEYRDSWATGAIEQPIGKEIRVSGWAHSHRRPPLI